MEQTLKCQRLTHVLALLVGLSLPVASPAQDEWIGKPTIGDVVRRDIADFARSVREAREAGKVKAEFNREIAQARKEFFATASAPQNRAAAEKKFADVLRRKDNHYLLMALVSGEPSGGGGLSGAFDSLSGGPLDGGIPAAAQPTFNRWVEAMRKSLGQLSTVDDARLAKAMLDNSGLYDEYKVIRDKSEFDTRIKNQRLAAAYEDFRKAQKAATAPDGSMKLNRQGVVGFTAALHSGRKAGKAPVPAFQAWAQQTQDGGQQILRCEYGPMRYENGAAVHDVYWLWRKAVPSELYERLEEGEVLGELRLNLALPDCPATHSEARTVIDEANRKSAGERAKVRQDQSAKVRAEHDAQSAAKRAESQAASRAAAADRQKDFKVKRCAAMDENMAKMREKMGPAPRPAQLAQYQRVEANVDAQCKS